jgi:hypothetical protein
MIANTNLFSGPYLTGNSVVQFPVTFTFINASDLLVYLVDTTTGLFTTLALTTDYSVVNNGEPGGTITTVATYPAGSSILILRNLPLVQDLDIQNQEMFYPADLTGEYDYLTLLVQQLQEEINRCYKVPPGQQPPNSVPSGIPLSPAILQFLHPTLPQPSGIFPVADGFQIVINGVGVMHFFQGGTDTNPAVLPVVT